MRTDRTNRLRPSPLWILAAISLAAVGCSPSSTVANGSETDITVGSEADADAGDGDREPDGDESDGNAASTPRPEEATATSPLVDAGGDDDEPAGTTTTTSAPQTPASIDPSELALPSSAAELAAALNEAELAVRDESLSTVELDAWGRRQQSLYRHLSFNDGWADEMLAAIAPEVEAAVTLNWTARQRLSSLVKTENLRSELPAWRVLPPLPPETLIGYYKDAEAESGISWEFLAAINLVETRMGRIQGISTAGAVGPMQFLPTTWAECCEGDPAVPADAIAGAAKYLTIRGGPENMDRAIFGYNNSDYYVDAVKAYASVMMENERAYYGYHAWEIYFKSSEGLIRIPVGYEQLEPIAVTDWLADHPETLFGG